VHLVDTIEVDAERVDDYLDLVRTAGISIMTDAGATFVSCATTPREIGEAVHVQAVWAFDDFEHWNEIRRNLVLDPRWYDYAARAAALRIGGTRRFYSPAPFPPA
jgi:hypothetical protein